MSEEYNGWRNYETWLVALWIDNEEASQEFWKQQSKEVSEYELSKLLQEEHEALLEASKLTGVLSDLVSSALGAVDWMEVAKHIATD